ncbi:MarR family winged helix-turn-helix transcriptional regulator [Gorillibacterium timonense]|uniref:MarR family winged helix-turn-helix transcriptional regulator n=1 Tax=Gorillibacterium timonense TaxID=1689269 RepID=UPI00071C7D6D|nr:MarR family winged helix-turn-helix transcriptional regulator [Gorillibacterium timonense]
MERTLSEMLLHQFHLFQKLIHRERARQRHHHHDFTIARGQGHLLGVLLARDGMTQKELSNLLQVRPASLGELVSKLELNGLVERRTNEEDKRVINVFLTEKGRAAISGVVDSRSAMIDPLFAALNEDEKLQLSGLLGKLIDSLEASQAEDHDPFQGRPEDFGEAGAWGFRGPRGMRPPVPPTPFDPRGFGGPHEGGHGPRRGPFGHGGRHVHDFTHAEHDGEHRHRGGYRHRGPHDPDFGPESAFGQPYPYGISDRPDSRDEYQGPPDTPEPPEAPESKKNDGQ